MTNWKEYKLGELIETVSKTFKFSDKKVIFLNTSDTLEGKVINHNLFDPKKLPGQAKKSIQPNDILYSEIRPTNKRYAFVDFESSNYVVSTKLMVLRVLNDKIISPKYLYYFLTSDEIVSYLQMLAESRSGTFPQIRFEEVSLLKINLPPLNVQDEIVELVASLDDKIELNNKINQELENLAQTLFKQWFIDFEFPTPSPLGRAGEGLPYKSSGGEMVDSELGEIPKGWCIATIDDITEIVTKGTTPTTIGGRFTDSGINFIKVESLSEQGAFIKSKFGFIDEETNQLLRRSIIQEGDVLFSIAGTIGRVAVVTKDIVPANTNQAIAIIRPNQVDSNFLKLLMKSALIQNDTKSNVVQAVQANLSLGVIKATKFIKPSMPILTLFKTTLSEVFENVNLLTEETQELTNLRDTLLPKLISGELEINNVKF
jgi:type I restriction enzyme S subunit